MVLTKLVDQASRNHRTAAIAPAGNEQLDERRLGCSGHHAIPLGKTGEGVAVLRVEHKHRERRLIHVQRVSEPVVGLTREVPEPDFPLTMFGLGLVGQGPVRGPGGVRGNELDRWRACREPVGQAGLTDARITDE